MILTFSVLREGSYGSLQITANHVCSLSTFGKQPITMVVIGSLRAIDKHDSIYGTMWPHKLMVMTELLIDCQSYQEDARQWKALIPVCALPVYLWYKCLHDSCLIMGYFLIARTVIGIFDRLFGNVMSCVHIGIKVLITNISIQK